MSRSIVLLSRRSVSSLNPSNFPAPWPFVKKGAYGQRKIGPYRVEKNKWPGPNREFPELSPKWNKENPAALNRYTGVSSEGFIDEETGKFVVVDEMKMEIVAPDLSSFNLSPYVSFRVDGDIEKRRKAYDLKVKEKGSKALADMYTLEDERWPPPKMTAETLFELMYADHVRTAFKEGKYGQIEELKNRKLE